MPPTELADQIVEREERASTWKAGVSKWSAGQWDVTVQKAVKASYMSECGQGLKISAK